MYRTINLTEDHCCKHTKKHNPLVTDDTQGYYVAECFKSISRELLHDKAIPMEARVYCAMTHMFMHYNVRVMHCNPKPTFEMYAACRLNDYSTGNGLYPKDVAIELIKIYGICTGILGERRTYADVPYEKLYDDARYLNPEEIKEIITKLSV